MTDLFDPQTRRETAEQYFLDGYNCCQAVLLAFMDVTGLDKETTLKFASGFGGGMGKMREVCGTVSAMTAIAGFISPSVNPEDHDAKTANYALVQAFASAFKEKKGSIICRELLGKKKQEALESPEPSFRTPEYYKSRPCAATVGAAAMIIAGYLKDNDYICKLETDF
ncbi:MAG: C-GCAxxG-C-C family protein [Bacteroidales bacterium]|nr:C-GCAxxG-C-C family protein [Bacteroidales bacterium]